MIRNLKIGQRLGFAFAMLLALLVLITFIGITGISKTFGSVQNMYTASVVPLGAISKVEYFALRNRILVMDMIMNSTPENISDRNKELIRNSEALDKDWKEYKDNQLPPEAQSIIKEFEPAYAAFENQLLIAARDSLLANKKEEATTIFIERSRTLGPPVFKMIANLKDLQIKSAKGQFDAASAVNSSVKTFTLVVALLSILLGLFLAWLITRSITRPMNAAVKISQTVTSGDLTSYIEVNSKDETGMLLNALNEMNENLQNIVGNVRSGTDAISTSISQIASGNLDLSARTESQASSLEETAAAMEELTSTVKQNADNARQANQLAVSASEVAIKGGKVVGEVVHTMGSINASSKQIVNIIAVIDGIAFQTNILALNAAVEAARAGEQGRGFAVVASEVRNLAQRSASAAKEIKQLIDDSVNKVSNGSRLVDQAGLTMQEIVGSIKQVADIMREISSASNEQTQGIDQIHQTITDLDNATQQNAALVEQAAAATGSLQDQATNLANLVSVFKINSASREAMSRSDTGIRRLNDDDRKRLS
jgi:methyl-accepting chemotaxis protein